ncbi:hypothetical protein AMS68_003209 [Peltaster fructicola]|uniref:Major facilitator superfamily (MFS) profile domain-containing protein n=1 Tax=Peltaster fructicola TaxID=286661 RepID=A0A6H0XSE5_9PEZI|nr:hypothetical protein AMS68_003209 [Peltaster fructicola]
MESKDASTVTISDEKDVATITAETGAATQDGGTRAWLQVIGAAICFGNLWGMPFAYGMFQSYYELEYLPASSPSDISWIATISVFLLICGGIASGPLFDWGYFKAMLITGAIIEIVAVFLLSLCTRYWQILLTQGVLLGIGDALLYIPGLALIGRSFKKRRQIALGLTTCGAPIGSIIYTFIFERLINRLGFAWTVRIMGFTMLASFSIAMPLLLWKARNIGDISAGSNTTRKMFDKAALTDLPFWSFTTSTLLIFTGYMMPFIYFASYGQAQLGMTQADALNVIVISQATSIVGRLGSGLVASKTGIMIPWIACVTLSGVACIGWIDAESPGAFTAVAALYGCFSGALIPLPTAMFPVVCPDQRVLGARLGMSQAFSSIGSLVGSPIAGALVGVSSAAGHGYLGLQLFGGLILIAGALDVVLLWILLVRGRELKSRFI